MPYKNIETLIINSGTQNFVLEGSNNSEAVINDFNLSDRNNKIVKNKIIGFRIISGGQSPVSVRDDSKSHFVCEFLTTSKDIVSKKVDPISLVEYFSEGLVSTFEDSDKQWFSVEGIFVQKNSAITFLYKEEDILAYLRKYEEVQNHKAQVLRNQKRVSSTASVGDVYEKEYYGQCVFLGVFYGATSKPKTVIYDEDDFSLTSKDKKMYVFGRINKHNIVEFFLSSHMKEYTYVNDIDVQLTEEQKVTIVDYLDELRKNPKMALRKEIFNFYRRYSHFHYNNPEKVKVQNVSTECLFQTLSLLTMTKYRKDYDSQTHLTSVSLTRPYEHALYSVECSYEDFTSGEPSELTEIKPKNETDEPFSFLEKSIEKLIEPK